MASCVQLFAPYWTRYPGKLAGIFEILYARLVVVILAAVTASCISLK